MRNISGHRVPSRVMELYPASFVVGGVAGGAGDGVEVDSDPISVLGNNSTRATVHGVDRVDYEALEVGWFCRLTLADTESFDIEALTFQHANPDSSGDPDTWADLTPADIDVSIITLGTAPETRSVVSTTGGVQDDITVATADGAVTNGLYLVRVSRLVRVDTGREHWRVQWTPNASASGTDTFDVFQYFGAMGNFPAYATIPQAD